MDPEKAAPQEPTKPPAETPPATPPRPETPAPVRPIRAPDPQPNPIASLPAPQLPPKRRPGRPSNAERAAEAKRAAPGSSSSSPLPQALASPPPLPEGQRALPADPLEREKALESVRPEAVLVLTVLGVLAARLPPFRGLNAEEQGAIQGPLEQVLWKYQGSMGPEYQLALAASGVALGRVMEWKLLGEAGQEELRRKAKAGET